MKKLFLSLLISVMLIASVTVVLAAKGGKNAGCATIKDGTIEYGRVGDPNTEIIPIGYDAWGYNYQAHLFNGWYWNNQRPVPPYTKDTIDQAPSKTWLIMKWSDEWLSNKDCNNDGKLDRGYSCDPESASSSACQGAWVTNHQFGSYYSDWDLIGDWVLEFDYLGRLYIHDMTVTDNTFTGTGAYPSGGSYTITWTVTGTVTDNDVAMTISYDGSSYYVDAVGTIASDGSMSGTWDNPSQSGTWRSISGVATREICKWNYFVKIVHPGDDAVLIGGMWYTADGLEIGTVIWGAYARILQISNDKCADEHGVLNNWEAPTGFGYYK